MKTINGYSLEQNYPNPFNPSTTIAFTLTERSFVTLKVYDSLGREVSEIISGELSAGRYSRRWNAEGAPSGTYFYRLEAGSYSETKKLLLLK
ncbi:MAG TPA: T9SS type A sorting domain-containing protein, partial [Ignavibacteriaceae bacterium]|nr:T9SS type A sorting domain-containing protein [Ignavibacteriaceae bacterium]